MLGVLVHDKRDKENSFTLMAAKGAIVNSKDGARVVLFDGNRQSVDKTTNRMSILYFDRYVFDLETGQEDIGDRFREPRERSMEELFNIEKFSGGMEAKEFGKFIIEVHKRLVSPLASLSFTLIGLACLLSGSFSRLSQSRRVALAIVIMVALQGSALGLENLIAKNLDFLPLLYLLGILPIFLGYFFLVYHPRHRPPLSEPAAA